MVVFIPFSLFWVLKSKEIFNDLCSCMYVCAYLCLGGGVIEYVSEDSIVKAIFREHYYRKVMQ